MQLNKCEIVLNANCSKLELEEFLTNHKKIKDWAFILHDRDNVKPHFHIYLDFGNHFIPFLKIASWFRIAPNFVNKVTGSKGDVLLYFMHFGEGQKSKFQYSINDIVSNCLNVDLDIE